MAETVKRLRVHGSVQGVFYRAWTVETARALGLSGWVRNRRDGSVEIVAAGPEEALARLVEACRRGPPSAQVERIDVEDTDEAVPRTFEKRPTL